MRLRVWLVGGTALCVVGAMSPLDVPAAEDLGSGSEQGSVRVSQVVGFEFRVVGKGATADDEDPAVAYNPTTNEYLVVWEDSRNETARDVDIYGRRVAADGSRVGRDFRIVGGGATAREWRPAVAYNSTTNEYLVVWEDWRNDATRGIDIYGRRLAADGSRLGIDIRISGARAVRDERAPAVAYNATANQYLVVWSDGRRHGTGGPDIYGRRVAADGSRVGFDFRISGMGAFSHVYTPAVAHNSTANEYLVVWEDWRNLGPRDADIYGRRVAADGSRVGFDFRISGVGATAFERVPAVTHNPTTNQYLVVWRDERNDTTRGYDIYGRRIAADGGRVAADFRVSGAGAVARDDEPAVAYNPTTNQYLVVWEDWRNSATRSSDIYGRRVAADGSRVGPDIRIGGAGATALDYEPAVACNPSLNQYLVVWQDWRNDATRGTDIYGRRVAG